MRFFIPILILIAAVGIFFGYTAKEYDATKELRKENQVLNEALSSARQLRSARDRLLESYNTFLPSDLERLEKALPDHADNIRLVIELEELAARHNLLLENVDFGESEDKKEETKTNVFVSSAPESGAVQGQGPYGTVDLGLEFRGEYSDFTRFLEDLERSLRLISISDLSFSSDVLLGTEDETINTDSVYQYALKIKAYWLK